MLDARAQDGPFGEPIFTHLPHAVAPLPYSVAPPPDGVRQAA